MRRRRGVPPADAALPVAVFLAHASRGLGLAPKDFGLVLGVKVDLRLAAGGAVRDSIESS